MQGIVVVLLIVTALIGAFNVFEGFLYGHSAMHQIYTATSLLVFVVSVAGIGIISAIRGLYR